jgi:hypothetical protein
MELSDIGDLFGLEQLGELLAFGCDVCGELLDVLVGCVWRLVFKLLGFVVLYGGF